MRQVEDLLPNLGQRRGDLVSQRRAGCLGIGRGAGAFVIGALTVTSGLVAIVGRFRFKGELQASIPSPPIGFLVSFLAVMGVLSCCLWAALVGQPSSDQ